MKTDILMNGSMVKSHISFFKRDSDTVQHGELRSYFGSRLVKCLLWIFINFKDTFKTLSSREILKIRNPKSGGTLCIFGSRTFVPMSWMCKKQTAVSHSSTESAIISLEIEIGLRLDGLRALQ